MVHVRRLGTHGPLPVEAAVGSWGGDDRSAMSERGSYFFAISVYSPLSSNSLSSRLTVRLPSPHPFRPKRAFSRVAN